MPFTTLQWSGRCWLRQLVNISLVFPRRQGKTEGMTHRQFRLEIQWQIGDILENHVQHIRVSSSALCELLNYLEAIKNRHFCTSSWWPSQWWSDASVTAEHHAWEFFNFFMYCLSFWILVRPIATLWWNWVKVPRLQITLGFPRHAWDVRILVPSSISECYMWSFRHVSCLANNFLLFSLTTFTTHSSSAETGT